MSRIYSVAAEQTNSKPVDSTVVSAAIKVFDGTPGGTVPVHIPICACAINGAWQITTGADVQVVVCGDFTV